MLGAGEDALGCSHYSPWTVVKGGGKRPEKNPRAKKSVTFSSPNIFNHLTNVKDGGAEKCGVEQKSPQEQPPLCSDVASLPASTPSPRCNDLDDSEHTNPRYGGVNTNDKYAARGRYDPGVNTTTMGKIEGTKTRYGGVDTTIIGTGRAGTSVTAAGPPCPVSCPPNMHALSESPPSQSHLPAKSPPRKKRKALDLFTGTGSVAGRLKELGYDVLTLDINPKCKADLTCDLLQWDYREYPPGYFSVIAASTPCAEYSQAKTTAPRDFPRADALVCRVLEIVEYFRPKTWWIENPQTGLLKERPMMRNLPFVDLDYCQFSDWGYRKPTRFWGSPKIGKLPPVRCAGKKCPNVVVTDDGYRHKEILGGDRMRFGAVQKGRIPPKVVDYLLQQGEYANLKTKSRARVQTEKGYKVCPKLRQEILGKLGIKKTDVEVDLFASHLDAQEKKYMTVENSAWRYNWQKLSQGAGILWANPPFEEMGKLLTKACLEPCRMVLVTPNWEKYGWKKMLEEITLKRHVIAPGTPIYEKANSTRLLPGRHWETWVSYIDTRKKRLPKYRLDPRWIEEITDECLNWGMQELEEEMEKYPEERYGSDHLVPEKKTVVIDKVQCEEKLQLKMPIYAKLALRGGQVLQILMDTGAEANLIKKGKLDAVHFRPAKKLLQFTMANGQPLAGGDKTVDLMLAFQQEMDGKILPDYKRVSATFYEADITVDAILSFPWMQEKKIGIFPHLYALAEIVGEKCCILPPADSKKLPNGSEN